MSTSLAEQLKKLAVPQTSKLLQKDKKQVSLLFTPEEAATIPRSTFYNIGCDGLKELIEKNSIFYLYEDNLFHQSSMDVERSTETVQVNEGIDKTISLFFKHLAPYFLLSSAHKALEWLIHRYEVVSYNKDDLILLILPYHETNIFVRTLQLMRFKNNDCWLWLNPLRKPGVHLTKNTLYTHAESNPALLKKISDHLIQTMKEIPQATFFTTYINFYCTTFTGAFHMSHRITENHITVSIPTIVKGLKSNNMDFCSAVIIVLSKLLTKATLSEEILSTLVDRISSITVPGLRMETTMLLIVLYQAQEHFHSIGKLAIKSLSKKTLFGKSIQDLSAAGYCVKPLLSVLFDNVISMAMDEETDNTCKTFIKDLLSHITLKEAQLTTVMNNVLDAFKENRKYCSSTLSWTNKLIDSLEKQYPTEFDRFINSLMTKATDETMKNRQLAFQHISSQATYQKVDVLSKLYHPSAGMRTAAVKQFIDVCRNLKEQDKTFIKNVLIDRLNDEDGEVVVETLNVAEDILLNLIGKETLMDILIRLLSIGRRKKHDNMITSALKLLCMIECQDELKVFIAILPFLLPITAKEIEYATIVTGSPYFTRSIFIKSFCLSVVSAATSEEIFAAVADNLHKLQSVIKINQLLELVQNQADSNDYLFKYLLLRLISVCTVNDDDIDTKLSTLKAILNLVECSKVSKCDKIDEKLLIKFSHDKLPLEGVLKCIETLFIKTKLPKNLGKCDFNTTDKSNEFVLTILNFLFKGVSTNKTQQQYTKILSAFLTKCCGDYPQKIEFLMNVIACDSTFANTTLKFRLARGVSGLITGRSDQAFVTANNRNLTIPYLMVSAANSVKEIRSVILDLCKSVVEQCAKTLHKHDLALLKNLINDQASIVLDEEQVAYVIAKSTAKNKELIKDLLRVLHDNNPIYLKSYLVRILSMIKHKDIYVNLTSICCNLLETRTEALNKQESLIINCCVRQFDSDVAGTVKLNDKVWKFLEAMINNDRIDVIVVYDSEQKSKPAFLILDRIDRSLFDSFKEDLKLRLLDLIVTLSAKTKSHDILRAAGRIFKHIQLNANYIAPQLKAMFEVRSSKLTAVKKRISVIPTNDILDTIEWRKGVIVLEYIQDKKKIHEVNCLIPLFFGILKKCLAFDDQSSLEYCKQLILSNILHCCEKVDPNLLSENDINVELIVQCIRITQNPQTHHHALLLLASVALYVPNQVLHQIMPIFTFMGSSVLRHDDAYSFQIIVKIIESVIPILIQDGDEASIINLLRVFVTVIDDIPQHRLQLVYVQLLTQIGGTEHLHLFMQLVFHAAAFCNPKQQKAYSAKLLDIAQSLCLQFPVVATLTTCKKLMSTLQNLPEDVDKQCKDTIFDFTHSTPKQFRHYKYLFVTFISKMLSSEEYVEKVALLDHDDAVNLESLFRETIITTLKYIKDLQKCSEKHANTPQAQYWKAITHHTYDILDNLNALLTPEMFLLVVKGLMVYNLNAIKRRSIELLNNKLQNNQQFFANCSDKDLNDVVHTLFTIVKQQLYSNKLDNEEGILIQTALFSLKLFTRLLASSNSDKFMEILYFVSDVINKDDLDGNILASVILCLAELYTHLRSRAIPTLNKVVPTIIKIFKASQDDAQPTLLLLSGITFLQKILDALALFLSPHLEKIMVQLSILSDKWDNDSTDPKVVPFVSKLKIVKDKMVVGIPARILLPEIENAYQYLIKKAEYDAVGPLMSMLTHSINNLKDSEKRELTNEFTNVFLHALQFRCEIKCELEQTNKVEAHIIDAFTSLILKLSETHFKPIYFKLYDWAIRADSKSERVITFYALSHGLASALKGLFVLFAGQLVNNAASLLDACNVNKNNHLYFNDEQKNIILLENVINTLSHIFKYNNDQKFINKERFAILMQPIVDQLDNTVGNFETRARELVIPCIVNLAVAAADDVLWKQMNYEILLKMRDAKPSIRLIALDCLHEVCKKLGEDFLPLLPETIPFLSELLEDEEESVEKACQQAIQELEKVLGEPLKKYF